MGIFQHAMLVFIGLKRAEKVTAINPFLFLIFQGEQACHFLQKNPRNSLATCFFWLTVELIPSQPAFFDG